MKKVEPSISSGDSQQIRQGLAGLIFCLLAAYTPHASAADAAVLQKISGVAFVTHANGKSELAHDGLGVTIGDTVTTEKDSSLMLIFADKGQVALRPETRFQIKAFHFDEAKPGEDNLLITLLKGGLRTITGMISKRGNRDAYKLESANATMGIRGTDFNVRLCDSECEIEQAQQQVIYPMPSGTIGRIVKIEGNLSLAHVNGFSLEASPSQPLFEKDQLHMEGHGHALLVFIDGTRLVLQADARIKLTEYHYDQAKPDTGKILFEPSEGSFRIGGGMIGKYQPDQVQLMTSVANLSAPNASFDLACGHDEEKHHCDSGLYLTVRDGAVTLKTSIGSGGVTVDKGISAYIPDSNQPATLSNDTPPLISETSTPVPELTSADMDKLFGMGPQQIPTGVYVSVNDGRVVINQGGASLETGKGESGYAPEDGSSPLRLSNTPAFINYDTVLGRFPFTPGLCGM